VEVEMVDRDGRDRSSTGRLRDWEVPFDKTDRWGENMIFTTGIT